jgi:hypothetical protein
MAHENNDLRGALVTEPPDSTRPTMPDARAPWRAFTNNALAFAWRVVSSPIWLFGVIATGVAWPFGVLATRVVKALSEPVLSDILPPPPFPPRRVDAELSPTTRGEELLVDVWRVPPTYREALALVARVAAETPADIYLHRRVHFVLSRLRPDDNGSVLLYRLRVALADVPFSLLNKTLRELEESEDVGLLPGPESSDPRSSVYAISDVVRGSLVRVQLRSRP